MHELHLAELSVIRTLQSLRAPWLDHFFLTYNIFDQDYLYLLIIITVWNFISERAGFHLLYLTVIGATLYTFLKLHLAFPRPYDLDASVKILQTVGYGFPSGAATEACLCFGFIMLLMKPRHPVVIGSFVLALFLVGITRVYLGAHFPSDVLGGFVLALILLSGYTLLISPAETYLHAHTRFTQLLIHGLFLVALLALALSDNSLYLVSLLWGTIVYHVSSTPNSKIHDIKHALLSLAVGLAGLSILSIPLLSLPSNNLCSLLARASIYFAMGLWIGYSNHYAQKWSLW